MKKLAITLFVSFIAFTVSSQIQDSTNISDTIAPLHKSSSYGVAVGTSVSTNGIGLNVTTTWNDVLDLRLGYEIMNLSFSNMNFVQGDYTFDVSPTLKAGGFSAIIDWHFLHWIYLSAGIVLPNFNFNANLKSVYPIKVGDIEYSPDEAGEMNFVIKPQNKVAPYIGIGIERHISRNKKLSMNFELGAYHMGSYVVSLDGTKFFEANGDPANQESINRLNETLKDIGWSGVYPVIKLGLSYKIWKN